ncbi:ATP-binding protein [Paenibacillus sp. JX-17]|uniref:histidine kinase n=1 Tax=Paenibacillus lacisoli TaxID=3064525 RepID=A0ABT9CFD7_9BACL|nr:ATP-binding protein [Paenibacillus sp. JX-17]MDO7906401.1 ATP-binding protein [Paenibacillus sp. JX-17]
MNRSQTAHASRAKVTILVVSLMLAVLLVVNTVYYFSARSALIEAQNEKMRLIGDEIKISLELSLKGEKQFEDGLAVYLRAAAVAAQAQLDPDIEKVTNDELKVLSAKIGVDHITLMKREGDDIIGYKSSDPKEIGMSTKDWTNDWFEAFNQLLDGKEVTVKSGLALPHYWSGPLNTSATNMRNVDKWGYYHDGTTNYIIDPYIHDTTFRTYQETTGANAVIRRIIENNQDSHTLEITVFNSPIFLNEKKPNINSGVTWYRDREVLFGSYDYKDREDRSYVRQAVDLGTNTYYETEMNGKPVLKTYMNAQTEYPVVIGLVSDLSGLQSALRVQLVQISVIIGIVTVVLLAAMLAGLAWIRRMTERAARSVQDLYVENIDSLFRSIREQRHDFNNHLTTINLLVALKQYDELEKYTRELSGESRVLGEMININVPALSALIQAKYTQAVEKRITFEHDIMNLKQLELGTVKSTELVRILSNLIDNAFDALLQSDVADKIVRVTGNYEKGRLIFKVFNNGLPIPPELREKIFESGFSTKGDTGHSGLGLSIIRGVLAKYKGSIQLESSEQGTEFRVSIPI